MLGVLLYHPHTLNLKENMSGERALVPHSPEESSTVRRRLEEKCRCNYVIKTRGEISKDVG